MSGFDGGRSVLKKLPGEEMTRTHFWRICFVTPRGFPADLNGSSESMDQIVVAENAVETLG